MFGKKSSAKKTSSTTKSTSKKPAAKKTASKKEKTVPKTQTQELAEYIRQKQPAEPEFQYIANDAHYDKVIDKIKDCKKACDKNDKVCFKDSDTRTCRIYQTKTDSRT